MHVLLLLRMCMHLTAYPCDEPDSQSLRMCMCCCYCECACISQPTHAMSQARRACEHAWVNIYFPTSLHPVFFTHSPQFPVQPAPRCRYRNLTAKTTATIMNPINIQLKTFMLSPLFLRTGIRFDKQGRHRSRPHRTEPVSHKSSAM